MGAKLPAPSRNQEGSEQLDRLRRQSYYQPIMCYQWAVILGMHVVINTTELCDKSLKGTRANKATGVQKPQLFFQHQDVTLFYWVTSNVYEHCGGLLNRKRFRKRHVVVLESCVSAAAPISFFGAFACEKRLLRSFLFVRPSTLLEQLCCRWSRNFTLRICTNVCGENLSLVKNQTKMSDTSQEHGRMFKHVLCEVRTNSGIKYSRASNIEHNRLCRSDTDV